MPRPTNRACARCVRDVSNTSWADRPFKCDHLGNAYDHYLLKTRGTVHISPVDEQEVTQELVEYALNRMLALDRDNGNKAEGKPASRIYRSRNEKSARTLANLCGHQRGHFRCIRSPHPDEPDRHKF